MYMPVQGLHNITARWRCSQMVLGGWQYFFISLSPTTFFSTSLCKTLATLHVSPQEQLRFLLRQHKDSLICPLPLFNTAFLHKVDFEIPHGLATSVDLLCHFILPDDQYSFGRKWNSASKLVAFSVLYPSRWTQTQSSYISSVSFLLSSIH